MEALPWWIYKKRETRASTLALSCLIMPFTMLQLSKKILAGCQHHGLGLSSLRYFVITTETD
jgi:hypothetical protein